jgi:hypothetical protein
LGGDIIQPDRYVVRQSEDNLTEMSSDQSSRAKRLRFACIFAKRFRTFCKTYPNVSGDRRPHPGRAQGANAGDPKRFNLNHLLGQFVAAWQFLAAS